MLIQNMSMGFGFAAKLIKLVKLLQGIPVSSRVRGSGLDRLELRQRDNFIQR